MAIDFSQPLIRLAVISDIHAYSSQEKSKNSLLDLSGVTPNVNNPLKDLINIIGNTGNVDITADVLICAGDICNQADFGGLERAWGYIQDLSAQLGANQIVATCGNHDLDSRFLTNESDPDPKGALLALVPTFPFRDEELTNKFWARNYASITHSSGVVITTLNTSAYHGGKEDEILHGRVSKRTITAIANELSKNNNAPAHVLVCHHHPIPLSGDGTEEYIRNGQELLEEITRATKCSCLIIHGHKHKPRILHGPTDSNSVPFVFGAGSLGARMPGVPNQFHIIKLYKSSQSEHASVVGSIETWSWTESSNWARSMQDSGLPPFCGFGYCGQISSLARDISRIVGDKFSKWEDIRSTLPSVSLLMPEAFNQLENELKNLGLHILRHGNGMPAQVGN